MGSSDDDACHGDTAAGAEAIRDDPFCRRLGIEFTAIEPGEVEARLPVTEELLNFNGVLHGGAIFTLADAAAGAAENAAGEPAIGLETSTSFLRAVEPGETLVARAEETHAGRRTTLTSVVVETERGEPVATFSGRGYKPR